MPHNLVKTKEQETLWKQAKRLAAKSYPSQDKESDRWWKIVNGIFQRLKGKS